MSCTCKPCQICGGTGIVYYHPTTGAYLGKNRPIDGFADEEGCFDCYGLGIEETCDECWDAIERSMGDTDE